MQLNLLFTVVLHLIQAAAILPVQQPPQQAGWVSIIQHMLVSESVGFQAHLPYQVGA
jgi:hypothetical protein